MILSVVSVALRAVVLELRDRTGTGLILGLLLVLATPGVVLAQEGQSSFSPCSGCRLIQHHIVTLGDRASGATFSGSPFDVFRDHQGRWWTATVGDPPMVFDSGGRLIARLGRVSLGNRMVYQASDGFVRPGGFLAASGDSVVVLDLGLPRAKVVSRDLEISRSVDLPGVLRSGRVIEWPTRVILSGAVRRRESAGYPLHIVDLSRRRASLVLSFGSETGTLLFGESSIRFQRRLSISRDGGFWSVARADYLVERYTLDGVLEGALVRRPPWFQSRSDPRAATKGVQPYLDDVSVDDEGRIWVIGRVAAGGTLDEPIDRKWRSVVEIYTPDGKSLLHSEEIDALILYVVGTTTVASYQHRGQRHLIKVIEMSLERH